MRRYDHEEDPWAIALHTTTIQAASILVEVLRYDRHRSRGDLFKLL